MTELNSTQRRIEDISLILKDLLKVIKVVSLYPENNPLPQNLKRTFAERLESLVEDYGDIKIYVQKDELIYDDETVFEDKSKEEALAGLFFETGITNFTFKEGLDVEEIYKLLDVIRTYVNTPGRTADLAALLWESNIGRFAFMTVEDIALSEYAGDLSAQEFISSRGSVALEGISVDSYEAIFEEPRHDVVENAELTDEDTGRPAVGGSDGVPLPPGVGRSGGAGGGKSGQTFYAVGTSAGSTVFDDDEIDAVSVNAAEAAQAMGFGDLAPAPGRVPDATLILNDEFKLAEEEEEQIRDILSEDAEFDMWESTLELLKEMLHQEVQMNDFFETVSMCDKVLSEFLRAGRFNEAGQLLKYFAMLEEQLRPTKPLWADQLRDAKVTAGSRDRLRLLAETLNGDVPVAVGDLRRYLEVFDWQALGGLTDLLGEIENETYRITVCDFLANKGQGNVDALARGIYDKRPEVVRSAVSVLARVGGPRALNHLRKVVTHDDRAVRLQLVTDLSDSPDDEVLELLVIGARDRDPEVRQQAVKSIVARRGQAAFDAITEIISDSGFTRLDPADREAMLVAYSVLGGDQAVDFLVRLAKRLTLFGGATARLYHEAAFAALSHNRGEKAERMLLRMASSWRPTLKRMAKQALQHRREMIYGGNDE